MLYIESSPQRLPEHKLQNLMTVVSCYFFDVCIMIFIMQSWLRSRDSHSEINPNVVLIRYQEVYTALTSFSAYVGYC